MLKIRHSQIGFCFPNFRQRNLDFCFPYQGWTTILSFSAHRSSIWRSFCLVVLHVRYVFDKIHEWNLETRMMFKSMVWLIVEMFHFKWWHGCGWIWFYEPQDAKLMDLSCLICIEEPYLDATTDDFSLHESLLFECDELS